MRFSRILRGNLSCSLGSLTGKAREMRGQALIETALAMPLLFLILLGIAEFSMASYAAIEVSSAASAGAQYGAQNPAYAYDLAGIRRAAQNDAGNLTLGTTTATHSCICSNGAASTCQPTDCAGSNPETILTVQTQMNFNPALVIPEFSSGFTLHGTAVQKVMQ